MALPDAGPEGGAIVLKAYLEGALLGIRGASRDDGGATAIEYALIAAGIGLALVGVIFTIGGDLDDILVAVSVKLQEGLAQAE